MTPTARSSPRISHPRRWRLPLVLLISVLVGLLFPGLPLLGAPANLVPSAAARESPVAAATPGWLWPLSGVRRFTAPFQAPAHAYGPGHRGIDVAGGSRVRSVADGVVAFRGVIVDRPVITVDHGDGLVATYEPVESTLAPGAPIRRGDPLGVLTYGGHASAGTLHIGVRRDGVYVDPLPFFASVPRAILLPCGSPGC